MDYGFIFFGLALGIPLTIGFVLVACGLWYVLSKIAPTGIEGWDFRWNDQMTPLDILGRPKLTPTPAVARIPETNHASSLSEDDLCRVQEVEQWLQRVEGRVASRNEDDPDVMRVVSGRARRR